MIVDIRIKGVWLKADIQGIDAGGGGAASYLVYTALLSQSGTDAPEATVLENTLGGTITWSRDSIGDYRGESSILIFEDGTTYISGLGNWNGDGNPYIPILDGAAITGYYSVYFSFEALPNNEIILEVLDASFARAELSTLIGAGTLFLPKIEVYPTII